MQIHVVRTGETLPAISQMYGATVDEIVRANELPAGGGLVVGQALVIPIIGSYYTVKPGDS
ncbi:LysM peptidoglycan-binding domain-containing protein, partial [Frankia sp. Cpl3]|nr:LysM peptidoglycan-binding domain-containing protein [Frankia sp. Cpl3]